MSKIAVLTQRVLISKKRQTPLYKDRVLPLFIFKDLKLHHGNSVAWFIYCH